MTSYEAGTPCWVDLASPDVEASKAFYGGLFGWEAVTSPEPEAGGYTMFTLRGQEVAAVSPPMGDGQPTVWTTYIATDDADTTAKAVESGGGSALAPPFDVMDAGRMAVFMDPQGGAFSVWQPKQHKGAGLVNEPGALCWNELHTTDVEAAKSFYSSVFGWNTASSDEGGMAYTEFKVGEHTVGGMMADADAPMPYWLVYFAVSDTDGAVAKVQQLGGSVLAPPMDIPAGRFAVVADPQGAPFGVITL